MNLDNISIPPKTTAEPERQSYRSPRLTVFGSVASLTAAGTMSSMEDAIQNGSCDTFWGTLNMTGNMC